MKIENLIIKNFKGISDFEAKNLKNFIVIAGPNGCGKSTIFDAIRLLKSCYGSYGNDEIDMFWNEFQLKIGANVNVSPLFRDKNKNINIQIDFKLSVNEIEYLKKNAKKFLEIDLFRQQNNIPYSKSTSTLTYNIPINEKEKIDQIINQKYIEFKSNLNKRTHKATVEMTPNGVIRHTINKVINFSLSTFDPANMGIIDFVGANRTFNKVSSANININLGSNLENTRNNSLYNTTNKYSQIKQELAISYFKSLLNCRQKSVCTETVDLVQSMKSLFATFFPDKTFLEPQIGENNKINFDIRISDGTIHDIDELSLGEKEIVMGYLRLHNLNTKNSILLFDEPELHLNPRLIRELPRFYKDELGQGNNQTWLITHSDALLKEVASYEDSSVYHMLPAYHCPPDSPQLHEISSKDNIELAILNLVGDMSQYSPKADILFLEGENTEFDKELVIKLFPKLTNKFNIISGSSKRKVYQFKELCEKLSNERGDKTNVYCIVDRDMGADIKLGSNNFKWDVYHIENYLLNPQIIFEVLSSLGKTEKLLSSEELELKLKKMAKKSIPKLIISKLQNEINSNLIGKINIGIDPKSDNLAKAFHKNILSNLKRLEGFEKDFHEGLLEEKVNNNLNLLQNTFNSNNWQNECIGRDLLTQLSAETKGINYDNFKNLIISRMVEKNYKPKGMANVLKQICPDI